MHIALLSNQVAALISLFYGPRIQRHSFLHLDHADVDSKGEEGEGEQTAFNATANEDLYWACNLYKGVSAFTLKTYNCVCCHTCGNADGTPDWSQLKDRPSNFRRFRNKEYLNSADGLGFCNSECPQACKDWCFVALGKPCSFHEGDVLG
eukprot:TRINITY_DN15322_c0_g2_i2.p1 TRINITY_DN15322_c0_g2~~TRINITY_DN15322_c0_g2_i2.p1  ORF type:complete len:150 (-),score=19.83 TRINITY_DN15322_c0_g2_i2:174-623(-)